MLKEKFTATKSWARRHPRRFGVYVGGGLVGLLLLIQLFYPASMLLPFSEVGGVMLGASSKQAAIVTLDEAMSRSKVAVHLNNSDTAFFKTTPSELGIIGSSEALITAIRYPWYLRLVPSSLFWAHNFSANTANIEYRRDETTLASFIATTFGDECRLEVKNATLKVEDSIIIPVEAFSGGTCNFEELNAKLSSLTPTTEGADMSISGEEIKPTITTEQAEKLALHVEAAIKGGITLNDGKNKHKVSEDVLQEWLDFTEIDGKLTYVFNAERSAGYLKDEIASEVEQPVGESVVTLKDFAEVSRDSGQSGIVFNQTKMLSSIKTALEKDESVVAVEVDTIPPTEKYVRSYSPDNAALNTLIQKYAASHPGTYAVSLHELSGQRRNASYRASALYTTASTYKLFVAYSTLLKVEAGKWSWDDDINKGRNLKGCFNDMIKLSDNDCAVALLKKITGTKLTEDAHAIGAVNTSFKVTDNIKSTAGDLSLVLALLESGQLLSQQSSRDIWTEALKSNVYRKGIPTGIPLATVADKVGFLDALLHDAAIVYSPKGTYVLTIMTEGSSWATIADLAAQIETLRTK